MATETPFFFPPLPFQGKNTEKLSIPCRSVRLHKKFNKQKCLYSAPSVDILWLPTPPNPSSIYSLSPLIWDHLIGEGGGCIYFLSILEWWKILFFTFQNEFHTRVHLHNEKTVVLLCEVTWFHKPPEPTLHSSAAERGFPLLLFPAESTQCQSTAMLALALVWYLPVQFTELT